MASAEMKPIFGFNYIKSDFMALHLVKDKNFGMVLNDKNSIVYFEYDPHP